MTFDLHNKLLHASPHEFSLMKLFLPRSIATTRGEKKREISLFLSHTHTSAGDNAEFICGGFVSDDLSFVSRHVCFLSAAFVTIIIRHVAPLRRPRSTADYSN